MSGALQLIGISPSKTEMLIYLATLTLFALTLNKKYRKSKVSLSGISFLIIFFSFVFISILFNISNLYGYIRLLLQFLIGPLFLYSLINFKSGIELMKKLRPILIFLIVIQFFFVLYKFLFVGIQESYLIGAMSNSAGSLSVIFPLFLSCLIIPNMILHFRFKHILLLMLFSFFSLVGDKRAMVVFFPLLLIIGYIIVNKAYYNRFLNYRKVMIIFLLGFFILYIGVRALPTLNPQNKFWGEFDYEYALKYISDYNEYGDEHKSGREYSRVNAPIYFLQELYDSGIEYLAFGHGPILVNSKTFNIVSDDSNTKITVGYQGRAGINYLMVQLGLLALIAYLSYYYYLFILIYKRSSGKNTEKISVINYSVMIMFFVWLLDFIFYSQTSIDSLPIVTGFHLFIAVALSNVKE